jgi:hypothetical protein
MTDQHPITPPSELCGKWEEDWHHAKVKHIELEDHIAIEAARWGADRELEACCNWLPRLPPWSGEDLRKHRRPKQLTPKELALLELADVYGRDMIDDVTYDTIRIALEALPE